MNLLPLYIDPGTGSALFSIAIGIAAVVYFLVRGILIKTKIFAFRGKNKDQHNYKYVLYAEDKRYYNFFEPILDEFESRKIDVLYLTSSPDDPVFSAGYSHIQAKDIGQGNKAYAYLNFLSAEFLLTTTPELNVLQWKRSKGVKHYCHFIHAAGGPSLYRRYALDYFDSVLLSSDKDIDEIHTLERVRGLPEKQLLVVGNTYFDRAVEKVKQIPKTDGNNITVLISPSWGPSALLSVYGENLLTPLSQTDFHIIIRPHPQSLITEKQLIDSLMEKYKDNNNIEWDFNHDNLYALSKADIMISDFSGIIYDFAFLYNKPVIVNIQNLDFRRLDAHDLAEKPFYYEAFLKVGKELDDSNLNSAKDLILDLINNDTYKNAREEIMNIMWQFPGESAKRIVDFAIETAEKDKDKT